MPIRESIVHDAPLWLYCKLFHIFYYEYKFMQLSNLNEVNHEYLSGVFISVFHPEYWKRFECIFISVDKIKTTVNATIKLKMFLLNKLFLTTLKLFGMVIFYYKLILYSYIELENEQDSLNINIYLGF